ncbi:hypothetical protein G6O67_003089 [Ophiocordyceps sinensis]|nr:hypothetical protein G6O67_003089 [Ophiocordyceps sinensis]
MARLETIIEERGPFDGVMGISESLKGAMLAASLLIKCQMDRQTSTPRFGIFFAGLIPLTWTDSIGQDVHVLMRKYPLLLDKAVWQQPNTTLCRDRLQALGAEAEFAPEFQSSLQPVKASSRPRCLHPDMHSERLDLPTVHVWGRQDVLSKQSELVLQLCNPDLAESYQHEGGHDVPQLWPDNEAVSEIIQNAILQSEYAL